MRCIFTMSAVLFIVLAVSCGGGDDDAGADGPSGADGTSAAVPSGDGGGGGGGAQSGEFCAPDSVEDIFDGLDFVTATSTNLEDQAGVVREALARWSDGAPSEIRDDVEVLAGAVSGLYELLEEYEFDFFALGQEAADDPRLEALSSASFETAAANIESYCGFDLQRPSVEPPPETNGGGGTVVLDGELPEGVPRGAGAARV